MGAHLHNQFANGKHVQMQIVPVHVAVPVMPVGLEIAARFMAAKISNPAFFTNNCPATNDSIRKMIIASICEATSLIKEWNADVAAEQAAAKEAPEKAE